MIVTLVLLAIVIMAIPTVLVNLPSSSDAGHTNQPHDTDGENPADTDVELIIEESAGEIPVYLTQEKEIVHVPLEAYIRGVVAAEMPADFHIEALKAQALAARTYIIDRVGRKDFSDMEQYGDAAKGAWVSDTEKHQVYHTDDQLQRIWGGSPESTTYREKSNRINRAVNETRGQVITYDGRPIYAAFFSTSNGKTENSEDYWQDAYPYLRSVDSAWDRQAPTYEGDPVSFSLSEFVSRLEQKTGKPIAVTAAVGGKHWIRIEKKTEGENIAEVTIGDQTYTGREVREALDLRSADFSWQIEDDRITITTRGYGHGVGMSQWGANLMAQDGKTAEEIIAHYYRDVHVEDYHQWVKRRNGDKKKKG